MKALVIADNEKVIKRINSTLESFGYDTIVYRWLLKALDNIEEISPHLIVISTEDYPRHWKTLTQFAEWTQNAENQDAADSFDVIQFPQVILMVGDNFSAEEEDKAKTLRVVGTFKKVDDIVSFTSDKVKNGEITLGNTLNGGSAMLTIKDVELSSDKIKEFESAAKDYTLSSYLDIDLYNIFYKGTNDSSDVWSTKISELDKEATITIKLADDVDVSNIVLVHNIHDGDTYEIIEIESYDKENHTITFKTKSFSNYAIATKNTNTTEPTTTTTNNVTTNTSVPKTGDNILNYVVLLLVSVIGLSFGIIKLKKHGKN